MILNSLLKGFLSFCSFANNLDLCGPVTGHPCPGSPPFSPPPPFVPPSPISSPGNNLLLVHSFNFRIAEDAWSLGCFLTLYCGSFLFLESDLARICSKFLNLVLYGPYKLLHRNLLVNFLCAPSTQLLTFSLSFLSLFLCHMQLLEYLKCNQLKIINPYFLSVL